MQNWRSQNGSGSYGDQFGLGQFHILLAQVGTTYVLVYSVNLALPKQAHFIKTQNQTLCRIGSIYCGHFDPSESLKLRHWLKETRFRPNIPAADMEGNDFWVMMKKFGGIYGMDPFGSLGGHYGLQTASEVRSDIRFEIYGSNYIYYHVCLDCLDFF